jgi:DNA mismatch repair ATPase MutS
LQDSLLEGRSRFYAEVTRVRQLLDLCRARPLLFLLDELFSGTNSDDRREGAEAVVRRLLAAGAIGLLTTHDLALTHLADLLGPHVANVHLADQFRDGEMVFDYTMRPGVLRNGNGVALMRALGIDV